MNREDLMSKFNVAALTAYCNFSYKNYKSITNTNYSEYNKKRKINFFQKKKKLWVAYVKGPIKNLLKRAYAKITRKKGKSVQDLLLVVKTNNKINYNNQK